MTGSTYQVRNYRLRFNNSRFKSFDVKYRQTDLWIGVDSQSYHPEMRRVVFETIEALRQKLDDYIRDEPVFATTLKPFLPSADAPAEAQEMAKAAAKAGIGPLSTVAGLFARAAGEAILKNFLVHELVIENGGDIFALLKDELILSIFAGESPLSEKIGLVIPSGTGVVGICTSAGTVGPSLSFGNADAVTVVCRDVVVADAFATALGNEVKTPDDIEPVLENTSEFPEIRSLLIVCKDKIGVRGTLNIKWIT